MATDIWIKKVEAGDNGLANFETYQKLVEARKVVASAEKEFAAAGFEKMLPEPEIYAELYRELQEHLSRLWESKNGST